MAEIARPQLVVMGVSGSGKSTVGALVAELLAVPFIDADDLHPASNVRKMTAGMPLTDDDRWPWLAAVGTTLAALRPGGVVVACSALRRSYRDAIREHAPEVLFVQLDGTRELLSSRISGRAGHFMPATLLESQLATLEPLADDEGGLVASIASDPSDIARAVVLRVE